MATNCSKFLNPIKNCKKLSKGTKIATTAKILVFYVVLNFIVGFVSILDFPLSRVEYLLNCWISIVITPVFYMFSEHF